ncbi:MAG: hypothetical protein Kow0025_07320 [Thermodesulfovibrionales bacterium]
MPHFESREIDPGARGGGEGGLAPFLSAVLVLLLVAVLPASAWATVKGRCKDCHEMHSSSPSPELTRGGCLGCHAVDPAGDRNIVVIGQSPVPQILHHMEDGDLAAGNFYYVDERFTPDYGRGHNVAGISQQEDPPMDRPVGFIGSVVIPGGLGPDRWDHEQQLTCAGTYGCHGNRTIEDPYEAIYGAHHEDDSEIDGSTVGKSYRFLYGIKGAEHDAWEYQATFDNHNGYKGDEGHETMDTISYLCGECHAVFHPNSLLGGVRSVGETVWHRHPTDISFGSIHSGYVGSEFQAYIVYNMEAPVAYIEPTGRESVVDENSVIMCLSCHRAHASPYQDMLRWDYTEMEAGRSRPGNGGCFACHTRK